MFVMRFLASAVWTGQATVNQTYSVNSLHAGQFGCYVHVFRDFVLREVVDDYGNCSH